MQTKSLQALWVLGLFTLWACTSNSVTSRTANSSKGLSFGPAQMLGQPERNPSTPFLRYAPDGRLYAIWSEDHGVLRHKARGHSGGHQGMSGDREQSPMRNVLLAWSGDAGKTWSSSRRVNSSVEAVQGEENGPKVAIGKNNKAYVVWSIPGEKGNKTRANIRFAMEDGKGGFTPAKTLNEVKDAARFPIIEFTPDGNLLIAWIDRRIDNPKPRQLYLMRMQHDGQALTKNYQVGAGLCECCKLGISFADGGKTVYMVDREVDGNKIRNHVLRKSIDGGNTFGSAVEISDDGWQVPSCPHSGPSIGRDSRGHLHVTWFTLGRSEQEAGIYYSVSKDGGKSFAPRQLVDANTAPEILHSNLSVGDDDTVYLVWSNLDTNQRSQIYLRTVAADGRAWSSIQQISNARGNASRPVLALMKSHLHIAWTET
ncbi:MAG: sialidase family protein, partial [Candidatus Binatia bacterium]